MEAVKLGAEWFHLIESLNTTHMGERMKLLHCVSQDMETLAKMLASTPRAVSNYIEQMCQTSFRDIAKWRPEVGWGTRLRLATILIAQPIYDVTA